MKFVCGALVFIVTWIISTFGFCQIVGSIRVAFRQRTEAGREFIRAFGGRPIPAALTFFTLAIWTSILVLCGLAVHVWLLDYVWFYYSASAISFLLSLKTGKSLKDFAEAVKADMSQVQQLMQYLPGQEENR